MPQFQSGSTRKLSIIGLVAPQQVKPTIGDDITNAINTVVSGYSTMKDYENKQKEKADVEAYQQHAMLYNEVRRTYIDENRKAVTADEKREVFTRYALSLDAISNSNALDDKYKVQLQRSANHDLTFASADYENVLKQEQKSKFHSAIADVITAVSGADVDTKEATYKSFLDASSAYMLTKAEAAEMFSESLVNATKVKLLQEGTTYKQAVQAEADVLKLLSKDIFSKGKSYMAKAQEEMFTIKNTIATRNRTELQAFVASEVYSLEEKEAKITQGAEEGWLVERLAYSLIEGVRSDEFVKQRSGVRLLQDAKLQNMFGIEEEEARAIAYDPKAHLSGEASEAKFQAWRSNRANAQRQLNLANFDNLINDESIPADTKIPILEQKIETTPDPMEKAKYTAQLVKVQNTLRDATVKHYENIIKNKKVGFEEGLFAIKALEDGGYYSTTKARKEESDLLIREEKRIAQVVKENQTLEQMLEKGQIRVFKAQMKDKDKSPEELISIIDSANFLVQAEKDMYKSLIAEGKRSDIEKLIKENKRLDVELSRDRKTILKAVVDNPEYPLAYKITKINESKDYVTEEKKTMIAKLREASYNKQVKERKALLEEERVAYQNIAKQHMKLVENGDMSVNPAQWVNAISIGWAGKKLDATVWGAYNKYIKQRELYDSWRSGVSVSNPERYANVYLKKIPEIEDTINQIKQVDSMTPDTLIGVLQSIDVAKANRYIIPDDIADLARVARQFTAYGALEGTERFKTYLTAQTAGISEQQRQKYFNMIAGHTGIEPSVIGSSVLNDVIATVVTSSMNDKQSIAYIKQTIDEQFIQIKPWVGKDFLVRKGSDYLRDEADFSQTVRYLSADLGFKVEVVIPLDSTRPETTDWLAIPKDKSLRASVVKNATMRTIGGRK